MPLTIEQCPLLSGAPELIELFNRWEAQTLKAQSVVPTLWNDPRLEKLREQHKLVESLLTRRFYRVGFLGRSQVGKSSTSNNVLEAPPKDGPCGEGAGVAATSAVTRIHGVPPDSPATCLLRFMNRREFQHRRRDLCDVLRLDSPPVDPGKEHPVLLNENRDILTRLRMMVREQSERGRDAPQGETQVNQQYLERFLDAYQAFGEKYVQTTSVEQTGKYEDRRRYTNHSSSGKDAPYLLLREVDIGYPTDVIPDTLEMIDLPGLGALSADDRLTESYLSELDGALVFQSTEHVRSLEAIKLLEKLYTRFEGMEGRVWMVITHFDGLAKAKMSGDDATQQTILDHLANTLDANQIPHGQVLLVSNRFYQRWLEDAASIVPATYKDLLGVELGESGEPLVPEGFKRHERLCEAFEKVVHEKGGVPHVREIIKGRLANQVREKVHQDVKRKIYQMKDELLRLVEITRERARGGDENVERADDWAKALLRIHNRIERDRLVEEAGNLLKTALKEAFERWGPEEDHPLDELAKVHSLCSVRLRKKAGEIAKDRAISSFFSAIRNCLHTQMSDLGLQSVQIPREGAVESVEDAFENRLAEDERDGSWYHSVLALLDQVELFPTDDTRSPFAPDEYRQLMRSKIDNVAHQLARVMITRAKQHLQLLRQDMIWMCDQSLIQDLFSTPDLDDLINGLEGL